MASDARVSCTVNASTAIAFTMHAKKSLVIQVAAFNSPCYLDDKDWFAIWSVAVGQYDGVNKTQNLSSIFLAINLLYILKMGILLLCRVTNSIENVSLYQSVMWLNVSRSNPRALRLYPSGCMKQWYPSVDEKNTE